MDYISDLLEEIALEGLDGITIDTLWLRLSNRPNFTYGSHIIDEDDTKTFLWNTIRHLREINFFCLKTPRQSITVNDCIPGSPDSDVIIESSPILRNIYPHTLINDNGIMGSCSTYDSRKDITKVVRRFDLNRVISSYGNKLVIVASQDVRKKTLISSHYSPSLEISAIQFCILERVGRSRYRGEPTQGKFGLAAIGEEPKTIFYLRKYLLKHNLLVKQCYQDKSIGSSCGLLLHLPRFFRLRKPKFVKSIETVFEVLMEQPNNFVDYNVLRLRLTNSLKKLKHIEEFQKYFCSEIWLPYRTVYPDAEPKQWKNKLNEEKKVRVVQLRNPSEDIKEVYKRFSTAYDDEDDEDDEKYEGLLDETYRYIDVPLMNQCAMLLKDSKEGLTQSEVAKTLGLLKIQARTVLKSLIKSGAVGVYMIDAGRQRISKFCLKHCHNINEHFLLEDSDDRVQGLLNYNFTKNRALKRVTIESNLVSKENNSSDLNINKMSVCNNDENPNKMVTAISTQQDTSLTKKSVKRKLNTTPPKSQINKKKRSVESENNEKENCVKISSEDNHIEVEQQHSNATLIKAKLEVNLENAIKDNEKMDVSFNEINSSLSDSDKQIDKSKIDVDFKITYSADKSMNLPTEMDSNTDKVRISMTISDDYLWLLPNTCKNEVIKIQRKTLNTERLLKRSNFVVETVHKLKVITDIRKLMAMINESEYREGLPSRMDKKSLLRILFKLAYDKHIKVYRVALKNGFKVMHLNFVCDTSVKPDDPIITSAIEFSKLKFQAVKSSPSPVSLAKRPNITFEKRNTHAHYPKFNRMKIIHKFLFTLVYEYVGDENLDQDIARSRVQRECQLSDEELHTLPKLYLSRIDERMFVPPLPKYNEQGDETGWSVLSDVILRMPLTVFLNLIQIPYFIPELEDYMNNPLKKYYLVNHLPSKIRNCIFGTRKYIFTIYEVLMKLVYIGLLQFGAHHYKEKDHMFTFLNRKTMLMDTTSSRPGYNKISPDLDYPVQNYYFKTMEDIDEYWHNCWKICMNTRLGGRSCAVGTEVILENIHEKEAMIEAMTAREFMEAANYDTGYVPGDKLGAAGFDSGCFAHLKRNWVLKNQVTYDNGKLSKVRRLRKVVSTVISSKSKTTNNSTNNVTLRPIAPKIPVRKDKNKDKDNAVIVPVNKVSRIKKVKVFRINPVKKSLHRKPFYDQIDKEALKRMIKLRVDWSAEEDRILLICKVASLFICPDTRKQVNANMFLTIREVLHKTLQSSKNKTSRACQRRAVYMLRKPATLHSVHLCVEELKRDEYIMKKYGNTMELLNQELKTSGKKITDMCNIWRECFRSLVDELLNRFTNSSFNNLSFGQTISGNNSNNGFVLPGDLKEFHKKYTLQFVEKKQRSKDMFKPVTNVSDIYSAVINSTIHSTLSCNSDKTSWSYHLFSIYQQYPERILRGTLNRLRENQMVSFKKSYQVYSRTGNNYYLPLSASPYQLSITYVNLIQTRYQPNLYPDCYKTFHELFESCGENNLVTSKGHELLSKTGGSAAATIELYRNDIIKFNIQIPDQIIVLDPDVKDADETYARLVKRYRDILSSYKKDLTTSVLFQKHNYTTPKNVNNDDDDDDAGDNAIPKNDQINEENDNTHAIHNVAKAASRIALYLMNDNTGNQGTMVPKEMDHVYDFFVVNSCKVFVKVTKPLDRTANKQCDYNIVDGDTIRDVLREIRDSALFCNIEPTNRCELNKEKSTPVENEDDEEDGYVIKVYDDAVLDEVISSHFESDNIDFVKYMLVKIKAKKEFGVTNSEIVEEFGNSVKTLDVINKLIDLSFVLKTGVVHCRYVYYTFVRPWLLHSYRNLRDDKDSRVPLQNLKYFKVIKSKSCEAVCSDDDCIDTIVEESNMETFSTSENADLSNENVNMIEGEESVSAETPSTSENADTSNENVNMIEGEESVSADDIKIDSTRLSMSKENLDKLENHRMTEPIKVVMKPWIRVDGTVNRRVLDTMLSSVLSHIMLYPGASLSNVQSRFCPGFQPTHVRELCDILMRLNCIIRYRVTIKTKRSLFSKPCEVVVSESVGLESEDEIRYESDRFAIINLGKFLKTRPYNKDFITCLLAK